MPHILFWIILSCSCQITIAFGPPPATYDPGLQNVIVSGEIEDQINITHDTSSADVAIWNKNDFEITMTVTKMDDAHEVLTEVLVSKESIMVISFTTETFTADTELEFEFTSSEDGSFTHTMPVFYMADDLTDLNVFSDQQSIDRLPGTNVTITATVEAGLNVSFVFSVIDDLPTNDPVFVKVMEACDEDPISASLTYTLRQTSYVLTYFDVTAVSGINETLRDGIGIFTMAPLPPMQLVLTPADLASDNNETMVIIPGEIITARVIFAEEFEYQRMSCSAKWEDGLMIVPHESFDPIYSQYTTRLIEILGEYLLSITCYNSVSSQYQDARISAVSLASFVDAALANPVVAFDADTNTASANLSYWNNYKGRNFHSLYLIINGYSTTMKSKEVDYHPLEYTERGPYVVNIEVKDQETFVTEHLQLVIDVGVINVYFEPSDIYVKESKIFTFSNYAGEELNMKVTYATQEKIVAMAMIAIRDINSTTTMEKQFVTAGLYSITFETTFLEVTERLTMPPFNVLPDPIGGSSAVNDDLFEIKYRNLNSPLPTTLSHIPTIVARSPVPNNSSYTLTFHWELFKAVDSDATIPTWIELSIQQPNAINMVLKNGIFTTGLFRIKLFIDIIEKNITAEDYMYVLVKEEPAIAVIKGGNLQQVGVGHHLNLDGSLSYDPADTNTSETHDANLKYSWACFNLTTPDNINKYTTTFSKDTSYRSLPGCIIAAPIPGVSMVTVNSSSFSLGSWILFELKLQKDSDETSTTQAIQIVPENQPTVLVICFWNCGPKLLPEDRTVLHVDILCESCQTDDGLINATYRWSLYEIDLNTGVQSLIPAALWPEQIDSEEESDVFDSYGGWWKKAAAYKVTVHVTVTSFPVAVGEMTLYTNLPPYGGSCGVSPVEGIAGETDFTFNAIGWKDEGSRPTRDLNSDLFPVLSYTYHQEATIATPFIYIGGEISTPPKKLVACGTPTGECDITTRIIDSFKGVTECVLRVKVVEYIDLNAVETKKQFGTANDVIGVLESQMDESLNNMDPVKIAQDAATYGTILKSMSSAIDTEEQFTNITVDILKADDGLAGLLDAETAKEPLKESLAEAGNMFILDTSEALTDAIRRNDVRDTNQVEIFTKSLTASMQSAEAYATGTTIKIAAGSVQNLSLILSNEATSARVVHGIDSALNSMGDFMVTVVDAMDVDVASLEPTPEQLGNNTGLNNREIDYTADLLAKRRRFKVQSKIDEAPSIVEESRKIWENMFDVTKDIEDSRGNFDISKKNYQMHLKKTHRKQILEEAEKFGQSDPVISFSVEDIEIENEYDDIHFQVLKTKNIFTHGKNSKYITSDVVIASMESGHRKLAMKSPAVRHVIAALNCSAGNEGLETITPKLIEGDAAQMFYHEFDYSNPNGRLCVKIRPSSSVLFYRLYVKLGSEPTDLNYDYRVTVSDHLMSVCKDVCIPTGKLKGTGTGYIGLRPLLYERGSTGRVKRSAPVIDPMVAPYLWGMTVTACYSWDDEEVDWIASKCQMFRNNTEVTCRCNTVTELISGLYFKTVPNSIHFGTVFSKFDAENQAAVLATLIGLYLLFIVLSLWAHYMDRRSILKWGVFPLQDNYAADEYFYLITVHTGLRKGAGTTSNISFTLSGEWEETGVRLLTDGVREGMPTGSVVHLVMAVPEGMGPLQYLRIWHDNSGAGSGGSWYLDKVIIVDLQSGESYQFYNQRWLRPDDGSLDVVLHVSNSEELKAFQTTFFGTASRQVTDDHMWLSVLIRPERSRFNRLERVGCCLAFLLLSMIASAMFYEGAKDIDRVQPDPQLHIGPLRMSWQQLYYSLVAAVITSVPIFVIVVIFRRARFRVEEKLASKTCGCSRRSREEYNAGSVNDVKKRGEQSNASFKKTKVFHNMAYESFETDSNDSLEKVLKELEDENESVEKKTIDDIDVEKPSPVCEGNENLEDLSRESEDAKPTTKITDTNSDDYANISLNACCARAPWMVKLEREISKLNKILLIRPAGRQSLDGSWPFVTRYIGWALVFICVIACSFFVMLYSMEWGKSVSEEWLSTFFLAFLQSLVIVDPAKVVFVTFLYTIFIRKMEFVGMREINMKIVSEVNKEYGIQEKPNPSRHYIKFDSALSTKEIQEATLKRKVRVLVRHTLVELAIHCVLLILVCSLSYSTRTPLDFRMQENVHNSLIGHKYKGFKYVNTTNMYYSWMEDVVTPWLFPEKNYRGESILTQDRYFTYDWSLYRLGAPRLRQLRMPFCECHTKKIKSIPCVDSYSMDSEVTTEYCFGWRLPLPCPPIQQLRVTAGAWYFRSAVEVWGIPITGHFSTYGGGGYMVDLDINAVVARAILKETKNIFWIDRQTRAVFLEFTLFNPDTDHFIGVSLLAEFLPTGGVITYYSIHPFAPYPPRGALGQYISLCEIAAILFTAISLVYIVHEFRIHRKAAFCNFWFMVDVLVFVIATCAISMYSMRLSSVKIALRKMREDPTQYVNFKQVIVWDTGFISCLGFLIALTSFRLLKLAGYSKRTMRVYQVLRLSVGVLPSFMASIWIIISSFAISGFILFHNTSPYYKSYVDSVFVLFLGVLGKTGFKNTGLPPAGFHFTVFYIVLFGCIVNILLANWFIAVLLDILTVNAQRDCPAVRSDNAKVFQLLWESFIYLFSKKHPPIETLRQNQPVVEASEEEKTVAEEFDDWIRRLNLPQRFHNDQPISSVALYKMLTSAKNDQNPKSNVKKRSGKSHTTSSSNSHDSRWLCPDYSQGRDSKGSQSQSSTSSRTSQLLVDPLFYSESRASTDLNAGALLHEEIAKQSS